MARCRPPPPPTDVARHRSPVGRSADVVVLSPPAPPIAPVGRVARFRSLLAPAQWRQVSWMFLSIVVLHVVGFGVFLVFVVPGHYKGLGIGVCVLAYTLGLRHAFDADHISAIDNTTRKLMNEGRQPVSVGYYFALGHSTIVVAIGVGIVVAERTVYNAVSQQGSALQQFGGVFGTSVSATFLFLIAILNLIILAGIVRVFQDDAQRRLRRGRARAPAREPRTAHPGLRPVDAVDHQGVADVPRRRGLRAGVRHRHRGRPARHHRAPGVAVAALVLDHVPARAVHGRDVPHGHHRRRAS